MLMSGPLKTLLLMLAFAAQGSISSAQDIHILLRAKDGKTWFHLGEPITLEAACVDLTTGQYILPCSVVLKAGAASTGTRLSADRIDQRTWEDATSGLLPPQPYGQCGNVDSQLPSQQSNVPMWKDVTLGEPFPVYVGQYIIRANLAFDLEMDERFGKTALHSSSDEIEIGLDDNLGWKNHLMHFHDCDYDVALTLIPQQEAIAALQYHIPDCAQKWSEDLAQFLHEIVWLKMQVEQPELYARMLELEHIRLPFRAEDEAQLQKSELEQVRLSAMSDTKQIQKWFHDQYRSLLLEAGRSLVAVYKSESNTELRKGAFHEGDLNDFDEWYDTAASMPEGADVYVSRRDVTAFLRQAGASQEYISAFLKQHKSHLPLLGPEYHQ
jgi:hypothetical protein